MAKKDLKSKKNTKSKKTSIKSKASVRKQNQFRVEYKDRISPVVAHTLATNTGSITNGPENSLILVPGALTKLFTNGTLNGEIDGNNFNPRYLNMKCKVNFDNLPASTNTSPPLPIQYDIYVRHGYVLQDLREYLTGSHTNASSGRVQPAFPTHTAVPGYWDAIAKKFLFNARVQPDFLSYEKKQDNQIRIVKTRRILGNQKEIIAVSNGTSGQRVSPEKNLTFNWTMPKNKQSLSPALHAAAIDGIAPSAMWVPFVMFSMETNHALGSGEHLNVSEISHLTYTDS